MSFDPGKVKCLSLALHSTSDVQDCTFQGWILGGGGGTDGVECLLAVGQDHNLNGA